MATPKVRDLRVRQSSRSAALPEYRLYDNVIFKVNRLSSSYFKSSSRYYQQHFGMGIPEIRLLDIVGHFPSLGASDVVAQSHMDKAMVSRAIASLLRLGYLRRTRDGSDSRRIVLALTESGRAIWKQVLAAKRVRHQRSIAGLTPDEVRSAYHLLDRLYEIAEAMRYQEMQSVGRA